MGEVRYYDYASREAPSVFPGAGNAPLPYGGSFYLEGIDSLGGWIASAIDLIRFVYALEGRRGQAIFKGPDTLARMLARPAAPLDAITYVGTGIATALRDGLLVITEVFENSPSSAGKSSCGRRHYGCQWTTNPRPHA